MLFVSTLGKFCKILRNFASVVCPGVIPFQHGKSQLDLSRTDSSSGEALQAIVKRKISKISLFTFTLHYIHEAQVMLCRPTVGVSCGGWERGVAVKTKKNSNPEKSLKTRAYPPSASKIGEDTADRPSAGPNETVVQPGSPCPHLRSPNS
jgi:hypothetical protein